MGAILTYRTKNGSTPEVYQIVSNTIVQVGDASGLTLETTVSLTEEYQPDRIIQVRDYLLWLHRGQILKLSTPYTDVTAWTVDHSLASADLALSRRSTGIYKILVDNKPFLCGMYATGATTFRWWKYDIDNEVYTDDSATSFTTTTTNASTQAIVHKNQLYVCFTGLGLGFDEVVFDAFTENTTTLTVSPAVEAENTGAQFIEFNGELFQIGVLSTTSDLLTIMRLEGAVWNSAHKGLGGTVNVAGGGASSGRRHTRYTAFVHADELYVFVYDDVSDEFWRVFKYAMASGALTTETEVGAAVLPAIYRTAVAPGDIDGRWSVYQANTPGLPETSLFFTPTGDSGTVTRLEFVDDSTELTGATLMAFDGSFGLPVVTNGSQAREFEFTEAHAEIFDFVTIPGGVRVSYACYGGGNVSFSINHNAGNTLDTPNQRGTITNASGGFSIVSNAILAVPADGTIRTVDWDVGADGYTTGDRPNVAAWVSF